MLLAAPGKLLDVARFVEDSTALTASYFAMDPIAVLDHADVKTLGDLSQELRAPVRYNLHESPEDDLHCMVIVQLSGEYAEPRKHLTKSKTFHLISGEMVILAFDDGGSILALHRLAPDEALVVRIAQGIFHTNYSLTERSVYHEIITGPYERDSGDRQNAPFAPPRHDGPAGKLWIEAVIARERPHLLSRSRGGSLE